MMHLNCLFSAILGETENVHIWSISRYKSLKKCSGRVLHCAFFKLFYRDLASNLNVRGRLKHSPRIAGLFFILLTNHCLAMPNYISQHDKGWHWYHEVKPVKKNTKKVTPTQVMNRFRQLVKAQLDIALLHPTLSNLRHFMELQQALGARASLFSKRWQQALLKFPSLDYSLKQPTEHLARQVIKQKRSKETRERIQYFFKQRGLFFFYRGNCGYCQKFAPIIKHFSKNYHIPLIPISMGGGVLPEFPDSRIDHGQSQRLGIHYWPALYMVEPKTQHIAPLVFGFHSYERLEQRLLTWIAMQQEGSHAPT